MSTAFRVLVMFHLLCVIGGFGALAYNGLFLSLARRRPSSGLAALEVNGQISTLAELLVYGAFLFGIAAVTASSSRFGFGQAWVSAAIALFVVDVGVLHGLVKPAQRQYLSIAHRLAAAPAGAAGGGENQAADVTQLSALEKRASLGWGLFNLIVVAVVVLMVFKPGA